MDAWIYLLIAILKEKLVHIGYAKLLKDIAAVDLGGRFRNCQLVRDLLADQAAPEQIEHLLLA